MASSNSRLNTKRSFTDRPGLLPAIKPSVPLALITQRPAYSLLAWTFGRGTVIWRIWPAVVLYGIFAAVIVVLKERAGFKMLGIPNVMLTVLGVVIGFVISYRAVSGYERYWMGRTAWSDVIRNARTAGRLVWYHVPPRLSPKTAEETASGQVHRTAEEMNKAMAEKRMALDLIEGFAVALKHHIRGEVGIYYEDLYNLVRPLHDHDHTIEQKAAAVSSGVPPSPNRARRIASTPGLPQSRPSTSNLKTTQYFGDIPPPPPTEYGTFDPTAAKPKSRNNSGDRHRLRRSPSIASNHSEHQVLHPAQVPNGQGVMDQVSGNLIPFSGFFGRLRAWFNRGYIRIGDEVKDPFGSRASQRLWTGPIHQRIGKDKQKPRAAAHGENLPYQILNCLSEWYSVLEERGTVPGTSLGSLVGSIASMEETLSALERILTTPLPFVYSVHIKHTVWIYLFFLPFQLVRDFNWYTIPGVIIASFIYLGFLAAGEEIEQPFGYDENDLDLDMFCQEIIHVDIQNLKSSPCLNAYFPPQRRLTPHRSMTLIEATDVDSAEETY